MSEKQEKKEKDWFKVKRYPHISLPINIAERYKWVENYVTHPENVAKHAFSPFIHRTSKVRKFRKEYSPDNGKLIKEKDTKNRKSSVKTRELYYANHLDSLIFSYYSKLLSDAYENKLKLNNLGDIVNAYRSVPVDQTIEDGPNKSNIEFANDVFNYIRNYDKDEFLVIAFDIKSFFDNIDHKILREAWTDLISPREVLPDAHFNIYKNITRYSYVDIVDIFKEFKNRIYVQKRGKSGKLLPIKRKSVSKLKFMRNQDAIAFCKKDEFLKVKNKLLKNSKKIKVNGKLINRNFGIPQGSPISSILANIYLFDFDKKINNYIDKKGIYRRYSDDMIVVCPIDEKENIIDLMTNSIKDFKLEIQEKKTQVFHFKHEHDGLICGQSFIDEINWNKNFIYLGFEFDGKNTLIRSASLSGYYRKMKRSVKRAKKHSTKRFNKKKGEIFKRRILKKFTYKGAQRRRKYIKDPVTDHFTKSEYYDWGNFLSYAFKAAKFMDNNKIKGQVKNHWKKIERLLKK
ncbi:reverse transcriptase domain-containing protein [Zunongwangia sp. H14]|uniref:reverse transcriptase domain-containing protein n=1 Tax=Zunongwangia sp. H14 TaxID=3240792 RepID=UPI003566011F